jgi:hypothetical protein
MPRVFLLNAICTLLAILAVVASGCGTNCDSPSVLRLEAPEIESLTIGSSGKELHSLRLGEFGSLTAGEIASFSVDLKIVGPFANRAYFVEFDTSRQSLQPFVLKTVGNQGEFDFVGRLTWQVCVWGCNEVVTASLYEVETSESGRTYTKTLLKQIRRSFPVSPNPHVCRLSLAIRQFFGICGCDRY